MSVDLFMQEWHTRIRKHTNMPVWMVMAKMVEDTGCRKPLKMLILSVYRILDHFEQCYTLRPGSLKRWLSNLPQISVDVTAVKQAVSLFLTKFPRPTVYTCNRHVCNDELCMYKNTESLCEGPHPLHSPWFILFVDGDNISMNRLRDALPKYLALDRMELLVAHVRGKVPYTLDIPFPVTLVPSATTVPNAADVVLTMQIMRADMHRDRRVQFVVVTDDHFGVPLVEMLRELGRITYLLKTKRRHSGLFIHGLLRRELKDPTFTADWSIEPSVVSTLLQRARGYIKANRTSHIIRQLRARPLIGIEELDGLLVGGEHISRKLVIAELAVRGTYILPRVSEELLLALKDIKTRLHASSNKRMSVSELGNRYPMNVLTSNGYSAWGKLLKIVSVQDILSASLVANGKALILEAVI